MCKAWQLIFSCFSLCALVKRCLQSWTRNVSRNASESGWKRSNRRSRKTPVHQREPRVAAVSDFPGTAGRVLVGSPKDGRCAAVRENRKFDQSPAQRVRSKKEMRQTWETPKRAKSDDFGRCGEKEARKQDKAAGSCAPRGGHICPRCGQFRGFTRAFQTQRKTAGGRCGMKKARRFKGNRGVPTKNTR